MDAIQSIFLDHAFVLVVLVLVFPFVGWWSYQRFLKRAEIEGDPALTREYKLTLVWLGGLLAGTLAIWALAARPFEGLVTTTAIGPGADFAEGVALAAIVGVLLRPILATMSKAFRAALMKAFEPLQAFLPKTREHLFWGLIASVAAGVAEEIAYRGYLMPYLASWGLAWWGVLAASALIFGLAHLYQGLGGVITTGVIGAVFGGIFLATGSLVLPIVLHALFDISAMLTAYIVLRRPANAPRRVAGALKD